MCVQAEEGVYQEHPKGRSHTKTPAVVFSREHVVEANLTVCVSGCLLHKNVGE